jgi:hypothetical protein
VQINTWTLFFMGVLFISSIPTAPLGQAAQAGSSSSPTEDDEENKDSKSKDDEEGDKRTITDKIKSIRSSDGEYDVFFMNSSVAYSVPYSLPESKLGDQSPEEFLRNAYKQGIEISVTVDTNTDTLLSIDSTHSRKPAAAAAIPAYEYPPGMEYLKDIVEKAIKK